MHKILKGQTAIVTGGARGIGAGICRLFAEQGATVAVWDVIDGDEIVNEVKTNGGNIFFQKVNITDREEVKNATAEVVEKTGRIDILINNAGIVRDRSFMKMTDEEWDAVISVNLTGTYNCSKAVLPHMRERKYGRIVSASSINGILGAFGQTNYSATKAAIIGFTKALAKEVGRHGITANAIAPGFVITDMTKTMPEEMLKEVVQTIPVARPGTPEDMAYAYLFLAGPHSGFVNGHTMSVNGGSF